MQPLGAVLFNIVKYKAMRLRNSSLISNLALYHSKVGSHLVSNILKLMSKSTPHDYLFAEENMLSMSKRQVICVTNLIWNYVVEESHLIFLSFFIIRFLLLDHLLIMMTYSSWIQSPKFSSLMDLIHLYKRELKLLKLYNISRILTMRGSPKWQLSVSSLLKVLMWGFTDNKRLFSLSDLVNNW